MASHEKPPKEDGKPAANYATDAAIDDSDDMDEEEVALHKTMSQTRRRESHAQGEHTRIQAVLPFQFLPNVRPLTISDLESCIALENAAFADPHHRCSPEKVNLPISYILACPSGYESRGHSFPVLVTNKIVSHSSSTASQPPRNFAWASSAQ